MGVALSIAIPIIVVAAVIVLVGAARRRETMAAEGRLSRETRRRDRGRVDVDDADEPDAPTGREVERAAVVARQAVSAELVEATDASVEEWTPPDPVAVGVNRRQFLNRSTVAMMGFGLSGFGAACVAFLWPPFVTGFGADVNAGLVDDVKSRIRDENGFLYLPEGRAWVTEYPEAALQKAQATYSAPELVGMESGLIALFQKCPHLGLPGAVVSDLAVVRMPVPRLSLQPGGGEAGRTRPPGHGPVRHDGQRQRRVHHPHRHRDPGAAHRRQHHRAGA